MLRTLIACTKRTFTICASEKSLKLHNEVYLGIIKSKGGLIVIGAKGFGSGMQLHDSLFSLEFLYTIDCPQEIG